MAHGGATNLAWQIGNQRHLLGLETPNLLLTFATISDPSHKIWIVNVLLRYYGPTAWEPFDSSAALELWSAKQFLRAQVHWALISDRQTSVPVSSSVGQFMGEMDIPHGDSDRFLSRKNESCSSPQSFDISSPSQLREPSASGGDVGIYPFTQTMGYPDTMYNIRPKEPPYLNLQL